MGGDLNLKKSWHVNLMSNQKKVWEAEKGALDERKKLEQLKKEREEERAIEELQKLQASSGNSSQPLIPAKLQWMYQGGSSGGNALDNESFLLGKRRIDALVLKKEPDSDKSLGSGDAPPPPAIGTSLKDIGTKAGLDPLTAIERQKHASLQKAMSDPLLRRRLLKEMSKDKDKDEKKKHRKHRRDDDERDYRSKRRRHSEDDEDRFRSHRSHRRRSPSPSRSRSRSRSPYQSRRRDESDRHSSRKDRARSRSRSPYSRRIDDHRNTRDRSRSPYRERRQDSQRYRERRDDKKTPYSRVSDSPPKPLPSPPDSQKDENSERAAKLAAMQSSASELEEARNRRLAELEARDKAERENEDRKRQVKGDRFTAGLRRQAENVGLGDRIQRSRGGLERP
ncbi:hypothetical protein FKW77_000978 [Venturia effusa]|uniref:CBF1-interacting co-repressor CIR N-terminal domain-containing protein n=1 Tax=Venturia effusa TaxID=50376 RepID=A0A517LAC1_9PEZI|nr:hypothetical protein FKW77_000978 [Venturia effusa]